MQYLGGVQFPRNTMFNFTGIFKQCENAGTPRPPALHLHFVVCSLFYLNKF